MLLFLVQGKLANLNLDERFALNVALRLYTRRIVIQERVEDLQLAVESYQKKINLSRPDSYRSDLRKMTPYTAYHNIQCIIYQDVNDINSLVRTDELHKFSDGTLNHVLTALNDIATGIQQSLSSIDLYPLAVVTLSAVVILIVAAIGSRRNVKKDGYTRFQQQEQYEHVGPEVTSSQEGKRSQYDDKRLCLADDLKEAQVHIQVKLYGTSSSLNSKITTSCSQDDVKKKQVCEHKTKDKAIKAAQVEALKEENWKSEHITSHIPYLEEDSWRIKTLHGRIYIPFQSNAKELLLDKAHKSKYSIHSGATKMYLNLKKNYWWPGMKRDYVNCVEKCLTCLNVKVEHQKPYGKIQPLKISVWKWEKIMMDIMTKLSRMTRKHDAIWVIIAARHGVHVSIVLDRDGRFTSNFQEELVCWEEVGSKGLESTDVVIEKTKKIETIRERLKAAQNRWKSYADNRRSLIEFNVGDFVMLKVSPWKGVFRFKNKGKLSPRFIGSFNILKRVEEVAYILELPEEIRGIHNTFHVSYLGKCLADESSLITLDDIEIDPELTSPEESVTIIGRKLRQLSNKLILLVKLQWKHRKGTRIRWEPEEKMRIRYPRLFQEYILGMKSCLRGKG
ncbi:putative reverse transcriptase domain-containing protein [Tanacetum coccineum]